MQGWRGPHRHSRAKRPRKPSISRVKAINGVVFRSEDDFILRCQGTRHDSAMGSEAPEYAAFSRFKRIEMLIVRSDIGELARDGCRAANLITGLDRPNGSLATQLSSSD